HLLLVGDLGQLPPVGHGAPFRDIIAAASDPKSGIAVGELVEIRRNSGDIVQVCADVRNNLPFRPSKEANLSAGRNLIHVECATTAAMLMQMKQRLLSAKAAGLDPIWDVQVIVATNEKSEVSRIPVNIDLQAILNPHGKPIEQ